MNAISSPLRQGVVSLLDVLVVRGGWPLDLQTRLVESLPVSQWRQTVMYQQCLANRIMKRHGAVVQAGPFTGLKYIPDAIEGCIVPKLLGCYEEELSEAVEGFVKAGYRRVVDVGCASGYYAAGLSMRMPEAEVYAFDTDAEARSRCARVIALNGLESRVRLRELCTPSNLESLIEGPTLLVIDCEGAEMELLDPSKVPSLSKCDIILEVHDFINPRISETMLARFGGTHAIEKIVARERKADAAEYPALTTLPSKYWPAALDERRPVVMEWLIFRPLPAQALKTDAETKPQSAHETEAKPLEV